MPKLAILALPARPYSTVIDLSDPWTRSDPPPRFSLCNPVSIDLKEHLLIVWLADPANNLRFTNQLLSSTPKSLTTSLSRTISDAGKIENGSPGSGAAGKLRQSRRKGSTKTLILIKPGRLWNME
ncbi:uncharacterized protein LAJ45_08396 [Morchella importuna]|uniref:uncharacterized protein n=1 Tax=Morchella importuna TaxID=1174673 RepID=UPI001E8EA855|nr:uncharacterized protein LAJ45_08396 [Morchella importuna]KAH8147569.1 hypothetical protein LAJ45_08396 [Morchella importuna]